MQTKPEIPGRIGNRQDHKENTDIAAPITYYVAVVSRVSMGQGDGFNSELSGMLQELGFTSLKAESSNQKFLSAVPPIGVSRVVIEHRKPANGLGSGTYKMELERGWARKPIDEGNVVFESPTHILGLKGAKEFSLVSKGGGGMSWEIICSREIVKAPPIAVHHQSAASPVAPQPDAATQNDAHAVEDAPTEKPQDASVGNATIEPRNDGARREHVVVSLSGRSQSGRDPDTIATRIMQQWKGLVPADGQSALSARAVPAAGLEGKFKLVTWEEGGKRGKLVFADGDDQTNLERGMIIRDESFGTDGDRLITMSGNLLLEVSVVCRPSESGGRPRTTVANPAVQSPPPLNGSSVKNETAVILPVPATDAAKPAVKPHESGESRPEKKGKHTMKNRMTPPNNPAAIKFVLAAIRSRMGLTGDVLTTEARKAVAIILTETVGESKTVAGREISPKCQNSGFVYGLIEGAKKQMEEDKGFKTMVAEISREAKRLLAGDNSSASVAEDPGEPTTVKRVVSVGSRPLSGVSRRDMGIYLMTKFGIAPEPAAKALGTDINEVYQAVGKVALKLGDKATELERSIEQAIS